MMKKVIFGGLIPAAALLLASCEKGDPVDVKTETPAVELAETSAQVDADDTQFQVAYTANTDFTLTTPEWVTAPASLESPIVFTVAVNDELVSRSGDILFTKDGRTLNKFTLTQLGATAAMEFGPSSYDVGEEASQITLVVTVNFPFTTASSGWISVGSTKATVTQEIVISYEANRQTGPRQGFVTFTRTDTGEAFATITLNQAAHEPKLLGFYFGNEGTWGANNASLDYYSFTTSALTNQWWLSINPTVRGSLGDVCNDVLAYGDYLLVVVNSSNLLEICDRDGKHLGEVEVPNCRRVVAEGDYAYVTSYAVVDGGSAGNGYVSKVSLPDRREVARCEVGEQPEGLLIADGKIYVANTYGYSSPLPAADCSIIDLGKFTLDKTVPLKGTNPYGAFKLMPDGKSMFVSFSGNYTSIPASCSIIRLDSFEHEIDFDFAGTYADVYDGKLYIMGTTFSYYTYDWEYNNYIYDPVKADIAEIPIDEDEFMHYGAPTGIWVNPTNGHIYIADQGNYTSPAYLYHYDASGKEVEKLNVGVCPGHLAWDWR